MLCLSGLAMIASPAARAHPDHDEDDAPDPTPEQTARASVIRLITQAKLPASWTGATLVSTKQRTVKGLRQTVFTFRNPAEPSPARQSLFVVLSDKYAFLSADHVLK
jgi:hypothetical protein